MENSARPVVLIDFSALFRRAWHVSSQVSIAYESTVGGVNRAASMLPNSLVAICCDGRGNWRKELSKEYKAQREQQPAQMYGEMDRTLDRLRRDGRLIWKFDGFEADDVIASAVMMATTRGHFCRIVSHDKDLLQLLGTWCDYVAIHKTPWEVVGPDIVREKYGVDPERLGDWLALVGDSSDNVKGCPGVGAKTATALLQAHQSLDFLYAGIDGKVEGLNHVTPNIRKNLEAHKEDVYLARKLVSLSREVPIRFDEIYEKREVKPIDERDRVKEAEAEADKYFGPKVVKDAPKEEPAAPETVSAGRTEEQAPRDNGLSEQDSEKQPGPVAPADVVPFEKGMTATALVKRDTQEVAAIVEYTRALEPRDFRETMVMAQMYASSRIYSRYPSPEAIFAAIVRGREMGYGAGASLDMFHVADFKNNGDLRLMMHAHLIAEQAMKDPRVEYIEVDSTDELQCTYAAKKKGRPEFKLTYTLENARLAGLIKQGSNWEKRPTEQLRKTCCAQISRIVAPGAAMGLYCMEEMGIDYEN